MQGGQVPPAPHATPSPHTLSCPRPGDRIMLVDDSNEDWWKVMWQGGEQRVSGGRHPTSPDPWRALSLTPTPLPPRPNQA